MAVPNPIARTSGAAKALGAPKGAPQRFLNKASGKMETAKAMKSFKAPRAAPRAAPARPAAKASGGQSFFNPAESHTPAQLQHLAVITARNIGNAGLAPLKQSYGEIQGAEQGAQGRYGEYAQTGQNILGGLKTQQEANAKTFENKVADNALKTGQGIETAGQNASTLTGGYLSPELRAELNAEGQRATETGAASKGAAASMNQNEANYLTNLQGTAAQKAIEGHGQITSAFGKQLAANRQQQNAIIGRTPAEVQKLYTTMGQQEFNSKAAAQSLGLKQQTLGAKVAGERARVGATIRGQNVSAETQRRGQNITAETAKAAREQKAVEGQQNRIFKETHPSGKAGGRGSSAPKAPSQKEGTKYMTNVSKAEAIAQQQLGPRKYDHARQEQVRQYLRGLGYNNDQVSAALNIAVYGKLGPQDERTAKAYGLTKKQRAQWFR